jgi:hypothetical protein
METKEGAKGVRQAFAQAFPLLANDLEFVNAGWRPEGCGAGVSPARTLEARNSMQMSQVFTL